MEDTLARWLPCLPAWAAAVRLRHLLHHTAGLPDAQADALMDGSGDRTTGAVLSALTRIPALAKLPGPRQKKEQHPMTATGPAHDAKSRKLKFAVAGDGEKAFITLHVAPEPVTLERRCHKDWAADNGYQPGDPMVRVFTYQADPAVRPPEEIADEAFDTFNDHPRTPDGADLVSRVQETPTFGWLVLPGVRCGESAEEGRDRPGARRMLAETLVRHAKTIGARGRPDVSAGMPGWLRRPGG